VGSETGSMTVGNTVSNVLAGLSGALVGGSAGAFTASNADLYNRDTTNANGTGGTGSQFFDKLGNAISNVVSDPWGTLNYALNSVIPAPSKQNPPTDPNPLVQANDGGNTPSGTAGAVVTPPAVACTPNAGCVVTPAIATPGTPGYVPNNATLANGGDGGSEVSSSILGPDGKLPSGVGGLGTPIPMEPSSNPSATAEQFATAAFNGQTPVKVINNITGEGSWVAIMPDGTAITYRPAGQASAATAETTATVEINSAAVKSINNGNVAKFKFPGE